jgi:hypothetical protein
LGRRSQTSWLVQEQPFNCLAQVLEEVPTVSYLHRRWRPLAGAFTIFDAAVAANDLDAWVLLKPGRKSLG